jgi:hypothetical protein
LFDFNSQEFKVKGDPQGRIARELQKNIAAVVCKAATHAIIDSVSLESAVREMPPIREYDVDRNFLRMLAEEQYIYLRMRLKLKAGRALVLVRGYADGELASWQGKLYPPRGDIQIYDMVNPASSEYDLTFKSQLKPTPVGRPDSKYTTYVNDDLPNLRAQEAQNIIAPLLDSCSMPNTSVDIKAEILEGHVYAEHGPIDRKVRTHLLVFLEES